MQVKNRGFTLIELAIVLVIIGLIVGGVLVGRDLVKAAEVRATVTQYEKFNQAVNTFQGKYGYLPGDIKDPEASSFGFIARGSLPGQGDGDGILLGRYSGSTSYHWVTVGEPGVVWVDLSAARLIEGSFTTASPTANPAINYSGNGFDLWYPQAKIGGGNYFVAESGDGSLVSSNDNAFSINTNFYSIVVPTSIVANDAHLYAKPGLTVKQAYDIDSKIDDGLPQQGKVLAGGAFLTAGGNFWSAGGGNTGTNPGQVAVPSSTSCYDNNSNSSNVMQYSIAINGGANVNCALSLRFQ